MEEMECTFHSAKCTLKLLFVFKETVADITEGPSEEREETEAITGTLEDIGQDEQQVSAVPQWETEAPTILPSSTKLEQDMQQIGQEAQENDQKNLRDKDKESLAYQESLSIEADAEMSREEIGSLEAPIASSSAPGAEEKSLVSLATPGLLFEEDKYIKTHPIVSIVQSII